MATDYQKRVTIEAANLDVAGMTEGERDECFERLVRAGYGFDPCERSSAIDYLMVDGNLKVPCSRYGNDSSECAPVAFAAAMKYAEETGEPITLDSLDYMMGLVVNDHDDVERFLGERCPHCDDYWTRYVDSTPSGGWQNWTCDACEQFFKVLPDIGEEDE